MLESLIAKLTSIASSIFVVFT